MDLVDPLAEPCAVCGDKSTGTHYGVVSCNGCKGFFRRTILRNQRFVCRFNKQCVIDKNFRCACRFCRFQKCLTAGMKREAIQFERDTIGSPKKGGRPGSPSMQAGPSGMQQPDDGSSDVIDVLMEMEMRVNEEMAQRYRNSMLSQANANDNDPNADLKACTVDDLNEISRTTLLLMVDWAKSLSPFPELNMEDKIILLKNYAPQHLILMPAFRSPDTTRVCLFNNTREQNNGPAELNGFAAFKTSNITPRVLDEIVWPMRQLQMKEQEFVCLKALAFLHPEAKGLSASSQTLIREARNKVLKALYSFIMSQNQEEAPTRYGNILLLAPALKALTQLLIENMTLTKFFGLAEVDSLLSEFILDDLNDQSSAPASLKEHLSSAAPTYTSGSSTHLNNMQTNSMSNAMMQNVASSLPNSSLASMAGPSNMMAGTSASMMGGALQNFNSSQSSVHGAGAPLHGASGTSLHGLSAASLIHGTSASSFHGASGATLHNVSSSSLHGASLHNQSASSFHNQLSSSLHDASSLQGVSSLQGASSLHGVATSMQSNLLQGVSTSMHGVENMQMPSISMQGTSSTMQPPTSTLNFNNVSQYYQPNMNNMMMPTLTPIYSQNQMNPLNQSGQTPTDQVMTML